MREVKFRAWLPLSKVMLDWQSTREDWADGWWNPRDLPIAMQYTGLKDKNGVEIYEGDVLCYKDGKNEWSGVIEWNDIRRGWTIFDPIERFEVIGNIYETPELLNADR